MKLFVGIDVSTEELEACFMNPDGDTLETLKVENNLNGASHLRDRIDINWVCLVYAWAGMEVTVQRVPLSPPK